MAELTTRGRDHLKKGNFAYVDRKGEGHLPIHDESHVRNAMASWNQTDFESATARKSARRKIVAAAKNTASRFPPTTRSPRPVAPVARDPDGARGDWLFARRRSIRSQTSAVIEWGTPKE